MEGGKGAEKEVGQRGTSEEETIQSGSCRYRNISLSEDDSTAKGM